MIESILVANRGEIACRIFNTARRLGIRTIAVFSEADESARHVREADEAICIGPAPARESYLSIPRIIEAARSTGARAIHPGYGFLSENAQFAQACVDAGVLFVGPPASAIAAMGSKIIAKARMRNAGVPVLPGYEGEQQDLPHLEAAARALGMPLIIKPAAGGGGKGMRIVTDESQLSEALAGGRRLAVSAFGDESLLLERYLAAPRHVEVQIFADTHGNIVHLGDRDCSIQRRHQKLLEEAPAPALAADVREHLRAAAVVVAREIGYVSAGTVEFLFDGAQFYFMEMNTRLQVEHTVTEAVTGLDLVEWQFRVASGEPLPLKQNEIRLEGHAIEARVCAEDPEREFLPSAGELRLMHWPVNLANPAHRGNPVRVDAGFEMGDTVPETYDSLLGKVIAWAPTREAAARRLAEALQHTYCVGVHTNEHWLARILAAEEFVQVRHSIAFLERSASRFRDAPDTPHSALQLAALATVSGGQSVGRDANPWSASDGFTPNLPAIVHTTLTRQGENHRVEIEYRRGRPIMIRCAGQGSDTGKVAAKSVVAPVSDVACAEGVITATLDGVRRHARYFLDGTRIHVWADGAHFEFQAEDHNRDFSAGVAEGGLTTPLPGTVSSVAVQAGQVVEAGQVLMIIEAMKMEHTINAPYAGTVQTVHFGRGDRVPEGSALLELTPLEKK